MTPRTPPRRSEQGAFIALVGGLGLLLFTVWAVAYGATHDRLKSEKLLQTRERHAEVVDEGLARALVALEAEAPDFPSAACVWVFPDADGERHHVTTRLKLEPDGIWMVAATRSTDDEIRDLPQGSLAGF